MSHPCPRRVRCIRATPRCCCCNSLDREGAATTCSRQSAGSSVQTWRGSVQLRGAGYRPVVRFRARLHHLARSSVHDANPARFTHDSGLSEFRVQNQFGMKAMTDLDQKPKPKLLQLEKALPYSILSLETPTILVMVRCVPCSLLYSCTYRLLSWC